MHKKKNGFTLAEVLISMVIIGTILAMSIKTVQVMKTSYSTLTYFAYKNLQAAIGSIMTGAAPNTKFFKSGITKTNEEGELRELDSVLVHCKNKNGVLVSLIKGKQTDLFEINSCTNMYESESGEQSPLFCEAMAALSNTTSEINCANLYPIAADSNGEPKVDADFENDTPNFVTTNGMRYFISKWMYDTQISPDYGFRTVAVDINTKKAPNTDSTTSNNIPDVVNFLIIDNGEIFPLGAAADDVKYLDKTIHYLTSRAKGYYFSDIEREATDSVPKECTVTKSCNFAVVDIVNKENKSSMPFRQAYCLSLGTNNTPAYRFYCEGIEKSSLCPPSGESARFDYCTADPVKPAFRYNM